MTVIDPTPSENGTQRVLIDCKEIERVNKFKYLGSLVTVDSVNRDQRPQIFEFVHDSNSTTDIKARLTIEIFYSTLQLTWIWKTEDIGMELKKQLVR